MTRSRNYVTALAATAIGLFTASPAFAGWQNSYSNFKASLQGDLYTPSKLADSPAILVAIHMCGGHSSVVHGWFDSYADTNGFFIIAPDAGKNCFDASASRDGDKAAIVTMVNYLVTNMHADKTRVFAAGMSSGGCMTNTLLAVYPDVFAGGSAMPGFPAGGWPAGDTSCTKCGSSPPSTDGKYWGDMVRKVFMWSGQYGCSQQWVGGGDQYNFNGWLPAVAAEFQNLSNLGAGMSASSSRSGWTRMEYKDTDGNVRLQTNLGPSSQKHDLETVSPTLYGDVITFVGLDKPTGACGLATSSTGSGSSGAGGAAATGSGGTVGAGGATATGSGGSSMGAGGAKAATGGTSGGSATGGTSGGSASGGTNGGSASGGSASGGKTSSGGSTGSGGMLSGSGGKTSSGGSTGSGGSSSNGSGGSSSSGSGGSGTGDNGSSGGCAVAGGPQAGAVAMLLFVAFGLVLRRRSRSRR